MTKEVVDDIKEDVKEPVSKEEYQPRVDGYIFYSKLLKKPFETVKELKDAEDEYYKAHEEEIRKANEKRALAKGVEDAYKEYLEAFEEGQKKIQDINKEVAEIKNKFINAKNKFIEAYGSFHMTYVDKEPKVDTTDDFRSLFLDDDFWKGTTLLSRFFE